jgi:hypothetical protein
MSQLLRFLIIILAPGCLCFAQESADKTSSSFAQKRETESQKPNSEPVQNILVDIPNGLGALQKAELSTEANSWAIQIITRGGFVGRGKGDLTVTSKGDLAWNEGKYQCNVKLQDDVLRTLTQTALSAKASEWRGSLSEICADCYKFAIVLQRRESDGIGRTYIAYWDSSTFMNISEDLRKVYDTFMARKGCAQ